MKEFFQKNKSEKLAHVADKKEKKPDKVDKGQKQAIESNFTSNQAYLTAFESFVQQPEPRPDKQKTCQTIPEKRTEHKDPDVAKPEAEGKAFKLIASTLHPKKVLREEKKKDMEREKLEKQRKEKGIKRKEREWEANKELERQKQDQIAKELLKLEAERMRQEKEKREAERLERKKQEREERKRKEKEEKEKLEKEKEKLKEKELMMLEKRKKLQEARLSEVSIKVTPPFVPSKPQTSPRRGDPKLTSPVTCDTTPKSSDKLVDKSEEPKDLHEPQDVKTPKKLRRWPPENESPDPKKNFIKKHQEQLEEQARLSSQETSPQKEVVLLPKEAVVAAKEAVREKKEVVEVKGPEEKQDSMWENLGYNSGDDVFKFGDEQLNKNPPLKPEETKQEEEEADKHDLKVAQPVKDEPKPVVEVIKPPEVAKPVVEISKPVEIAKPVEKEEISAPAVQPATTQPPTCMEQEKLQQQQQLDQVQEQQPQLQCSQQQAQVPIEQCAVLQEQQRKLEQQHHHQPPVQMDHQQHIEQQQLPAMEHQQLEPQQHHMEQSQIEQQQHMDQQQHGHLEQQTQQYLGGYYPTQVNSQT